MSESDFKETGTFKILLIVLIAWIVLAIVFGFTDLQISQAVNIDINQAWGDFGADYGEAPGYGFIAIGVVILIGAGTTDLKKQKIGAMVVGIIGIGIMIYGIVDDSLSTAKVGGGIGIAVVLFLLIFYQKDWSNYKSIAAIIVLLALLNPLIFVQITKLLCQRVRYRDLVPPGFTDFTPWWSPPGLGSSIDNNSSFPSGHTAMGWMFLPLIIIVKDQKMPIKILGYSWAIGWGIFVGASRIVVGAHYASDVLFSTGMGWLITIFLYYMFYLRKE